MNITQHILPDIEYNQQQFKKDLIVLHHTAGKNPFDWWIFDKGAKRIATCYSIEQDGSIFQHYKDDTMWAWHVGLKIPTVQARSVEERSIGIELVSMGGLNYHPDGKYYDCNNNQFNGLIYDNKKSYRDYWFFEQYTQKQIDAGKDLCSFLINKHNIPKDTPVQSWEVNKYFKTYTGVVHHSQLRSDKSDLHPGYPWDQFCIDLQLNRID